MNNLDKRLIFSVEDYTLQEISDSQIMELEMKVVAEGENRHGLPITRDAVISSAETIIGKPVLFKFNSSTQDLMGHEADEIACGVCGLTKDDYYFKEVDGKLWLVVKAYLWKLYFEEVINVFVRDKEKAISMEMFIVDSEENEDEETTYITSFCFAGVTLLGKVYTPAIPNASAIVTKYNKENFTTMVSDMKEVLFKAEKAKPKAKKLQSKLADIPNINTLTTKAKEENKLEKFNKKKYLKEFSVTAREMMDKMDNALSGYKCKDNYCRYYVRDFCSKYIYARDYEEDTVVAIPYTYSEKQPMVDMGNVKYAYMRYVVDEDSDAKSEDMVQLYADKLVKENSEELIKNHEKAIAAHEKVVSEYDKKVKEFTAKIEEFEKTNKTITEEKESLDTKITEFTKTVETLENEKKELTEFKDNVLKQEKENRVNYAINSVKDSLNEEQIKEWTNKVDEFESIEAFTNAIQAFAYTQVKDIPKDEITRISIPKPNNINENKGLWS